VEEHETMKITVRKKYGGNMGVSNSIDTQSITKRYNIEMDYMYTNIKKNQDAYYKEDEH
jgi:hypothetical protein